MWDARGRTSEAQRRTLRIRLLRGGRSGTYAGIAFRRGLFESSPRYCVASKNGRHENRLCTRLTATHAHARGISPAFLHQQRLVPQSAENREAASQLEIQPCHSTSI